MRELFARLVGAPEPNQHRHDPGGVIRVAIAAQNLPVEQGQNIVLLHEQFPGNVHAWRRKAEVSGAEIRTVVPPEARIGPLAGTERLLEAIDATPQWSPCLRSTGSTVRSST